MKRNMNLRGQKSLSVRDKPEEPEDEAENKKGQIRFISIDLKSDK